MKYDVYLEELFFYVVKSFNRSRSSNIITYNGIGTGYFPKADDPELIGWVWECELQQAPEHYHDARFMPASEIIKRLEQMQDNKEPVRLVMKSDLDSLSELVLVESYQKNEVYAGVYKVTVTVTQHKDAAIRNAEIPEIPRPGKVPQEPPHSVPENETSYDQTNEAQESWEQPERTPGKGPSPGGGTVIDPGTGNEILLPVDPGESEFEWNVKNDWFHQELLPDLNEFATNVNTDWWHDKFNQVFNGITDAYKKFSDSFKK